MSATIINGPTDLKNILGLNSGKKIGICIAGIASDPNVHTTTRRTCLGNLYNMIKMKSLEDITICCPLELPISFSGQYKVSQDMLSNVSNNLDDFLCDYIYIDTEQFNITTSLVNPYDSLMARANKIFIPFTESVSVSNITRYILSNMRVPLKTQTPNFPSLKRKLVPQFMYFKWLQDFHEVPIKNETLYNLSILDISKVTIEEIELILTPYPYYKILNLDGDPATIEEIREGKAICYIYESNVEKTTLENRTGRVSWFGFGVGDLFDYTTKTFERNVLDVEIDNLLDTNWGSFRLYVNPDTLAKYWDLFREDMKTYYLGKYK